jgi:hypothetical protein
MCDGSRANRLPSVLFSFFVKATNRKAIAVAQNDPLRLAARSIYDTVYPSEEWTPVPFEEAERLETVHYRNAVAAARFFQPVDQGALI